MQTDRIASALGIGRTSFWRYSKELIDHGYLIREQGSDNRGRFSSNDYVVLSEPDLSRVEEPCSPCSKNPCTVNTVNGDLEQHKKTNSFKKTIEKKEDPIYPPKGEETRFDEFWDVYDKKVAVAVARKKYKQALKKVDEDTLIEAARKYVQSRKAIGKHPQFTSNPATWLNQERWNDEVADTSPGVTFEEKGWDFDWNE